jgi:manganese-dependent inorganic pyrophosphatase
MVTTVYVIGHRNPDTDSIVSATAYARLKQLMGQKEYRAARAGKLSPQTEYIFHRFNISAPEYVSDLLPKTAYYMSGSCDTVNEYKSLWSAVGKMQSSNGKVLPVVDSDGKYKALLHYNAFAQNVLNILNPEKETAIATSIALIRDTLSAQPLTVVKPDDIFKSTILVGAAKFETFKKLLDAHMSENVIVVTGDRDDVQEYCIEKGIRALVVTSGFLPKKELYARAEKKGTSVLVSPYDTSSTAMLIVYSTPVSVMADAKIVPVKSMDTVQKIKPLLQESPSRCLPVVDDDGRVTGIISESDLLHEANIQVVLVDHNELVQAVEGAEHYVIREIIDHHRLGTIATKYPITFINKPVGSTSTLITNLYRENRVSIPLDMAQILLCGILSDTLILQSGTTTDIDRETAEYLSNITGLDCKKLGTDIVTAGSHIGGRRAEEVIHQDMKEYTDDTLRYTVSQIEVDNTDEILDRKKEFLEELEIGRRSSGAVFSALLVTDITKLSSIMLLAADPRFVPFVNFPRNEENVYYLKDVVSRKKQLIPLLSEQVQRFRG